MIFCVADFNHSRISYLLEWITYFSAPFIVVLLLSWIYYKKRTGFKKLIGILSIILFLYIFISCGPLISNTLFGTSYGMVALLINFPMIFYVMFGVIAITYAVLSKNIIALFFGIVAVLSILYSELIFVSKLDYDPYQEFRSIIHFELYRAIVRSFLGILLMSVTVFFSFLSLNLSQKIK